LSRLAAALIVSGAICASAASASTPAGAASGFDYLAIRAGEDAASGGHAAIRFGDEVFDFQHDAGLLRPRRSDWARFQHEYRTLQNRSIELTRVAASAETVALLHRAFERRLLAQERQVALHAELQREIVLLEALAPGNASEPRVAVRGAGFFERDGVAPSGPPPRVLAALRARVAERHGETWLAERRVQAEQRLRGVSLAPIDATRIDVGPLRYPALPDSIARRAEQAQAALFAIDLLERPAPLRADALAAAERARGLPLAAAERLREAQRALLERAAALVASRRPDWGEALLLAMARLAAFEASLDAGRLLVLDALPSQATTLPLTPSRRALLPLLRAEAEAAAAEARARFFAGYGFAEAEWTALEGAESRLAVLLAAEEGAQALPVAPGTLLPERTADAALSIRPLAGGDEIARALAAARRSERLLRAAIAEHYGYDLVTGNCVSELFRTVEAALAGAARDAERSATDVRAEMERRLGGYVHPVARGNFIPFVSSRAVRSRWRVRERIHLPSYREFHVSALRAGDGAWRARLRESNVFTARFGAPAEKSGFFVFFTDGSRPLRPLLGAVNLAAALARAGVGLVQAPFDGGEGLVDGLEGGLWSIPELLFANVRKGGNDYVPPAQRLPDGGGCPDGDGASASCVAVAP
jgi:hypothetical protein